jgi:hypothetical protein
MAVRFRCETGITHANLGQAFSKLSNRDISLLPEWNLIMVVAWPRKARSRESYEPLRMAQELYTLTQ